MDLNLATVSLEGFLSRLVCNRFVAHEDRWILSDLNRLVVIFLFYGTNKLNSFFRYSISVSALLPSFKQFQLRSHVKGTSTKLNINGNQQTYVEHKLTGLLAKS